MQTCEIIKPALSLHPGPGQGATWPTPGQELLLKASLLDAPGAPDVWQRWQETECLHSIDQASWKLLPGVYANLNRLGFRDTLLDEARMIYRYYWACNQTLFHRSREFLDELKSLDIPAIVLKGVVMSCLYYRDTGARPMQDLDLLVPVDKFFPLVNYLEQSGWREAEGYQAIYFNQDNLPSFEFRRSDGFGVDLHAHVLHLDCRKGADDAFWGGARPWDFKGYPALTLCPEDHLLHVVSHGARWSPVPHCRWMTDAWWILQRAGRSFHWDRVIDQARFHQNALWLFHGLERMRTIVPLDLPDGVMDQLGALPSTLKRRVDFASNLLPEPVTLADRLSCVRQELEKLEPKAGLTRKLAMFRSYLMEAWNVSSVFLLPFAAVIMLMKHAWHHFKLFASPRPRWKFALNSLQSLILFWRRGRSPLQRTRVP